MGELKRAGCVILSSATTVAEAVLLEQQGADAIIAQGAEAGGTSRDFYQRSRERVGPGRWPWSRCRCHGGARVRVPVVAAGGIFDGRGIAAAFKLGAAGVQMGTAFLGCPEANVPTPYREDPSRCDRCQYASNPRVHGTTGPHSPQSLLGRDGRARAGDPRLSAAASLTISLGRNADGMMVRPDFCRCGAAGCVHNKGNTCGSTCGKTGWRSARLASLSEETRLVPHCFFPPFALRARTGDDRNRRVRSRMLHLAHGCQRH